MPNPPPALEPIQTTADGLIILPPGPDYTLRKSGFGWSNPLHEENSGSHGQENGVERKQADRD